MKVLLDECTPRLLQRQLPEFEIATVQELGWTGIKNGELLRLAENEFDVFKRAIKTCVINKTYWAEVSPLSSCPVIKFLS